MNAKVILFDFDGTIADTYNTFVTIVNRLSREFGYKPFTPQDLERLKNLSSMEIVKQSAISLIQIPFFLKRVKDELTQEIGSLKTFPGLTSCLFQLRKEGYILGIVTSNDKENVLTFLKNNHLDNIFNFIYAGVTLFGKHKVINQIIKQNQFQREQVIYVGDETRDINAAQKSQVKIISVGWGFNSREILAKHQPDALISYPYDLIKAVETCNQACLQMLY